MMEGEGERTRNIKTSWYSCVHEAELQDNLCSCCNQTSSPSASRLSSFPTTWSSRLDIDQRRPSDDWIDAWRASSSCDPNLGKETSLHFHILICLPFTTTTPMSFSYIWRAGVRLLVVFPSLLLMGGLLVYTMYIVRFPSIGRFEKNDANHN